MEKSVRDGLWKLNKAIKPQVVITNNDERDESFLRNGIAQDAPALGVAQIELPHAASSLGWISDLDTDSLKGSVLHDLIHSSACISNTPVQPGVNFR